MTFAQVFDLDDLRWSDQPSRDGLRCVGSVAGRLDFSVSGDRIVFDLNHASRGDEFAQVDPTLGRLLGRPPTSLRDVVATKFGRRTDCDA